MQLLAGIVRSAGGIVVYTPRTHWELYLLECVMLIKADYLYLLACVFCFTYCTSRVWGN